MYLQSLLMYTLCLANATLVLASREASQLHEDLLFWYIKDVRPVHNASQRLTVGFGASLIRIIQVDEVNQVLTTNLWLEMQWVDEKLSWIPENYDGIGKIHIPSDQIWTPDIVLYNNAHGNPDISIQTDALVNHDGRVVWRPPGTYNSFCEFDIEYFPYDSQICAMKFGGWSHTMNYLDIYQIPMQAGDEVVDIYEQPDIHYQYLEHGMDITYFYESAEWDLMNLTSRRNEKVYPGCCGKDVYVDITFTITLRRKPIFFTVNLSVPCMLIAILTTFVFYIPAADHKIGFSISILVTLCVFLIVLIDLIPPTSLVVPLIAKYVVFTMSLIGVSIFVSVFTLHIFHRNGVTHTMSHWMRWLFVRKLPPLLCIKSQWATKLERKSDNTRSSRCRRASPCFLTVDSENSLATSAVKTGFDPIIIQRIIDNVAYIAEYFNKVETQNKNSEEWCFVAMVIDRLFLLIFTTVNALGTIWFILQAQSLYDSNMPLRKPTLSRPLATEFL